MLAAIKHPIICSIRLDPILIVINIICENTIFFPLASGVLVVHQYDERRTEKRTKIALLLRINGK